MSATGATGTGRLPNFIYIGPDKAGSSWLHEVLIRHPQIFMPEAKDLYFFDRYYSRGLEWYARHFAPAGPQHRVVGEVCQDYLFHPDAPARIRESIGPLRTMVTLRDPVERAFSSYLYMLKQGERPGEFLEALDTRPELLEHGRYATHLHRFIAEFGRDTVHVAVFDDLVEDPQVFVDRLLQFLGVEPMVLTAEQRAAQLPAGRARSVAVARAARWMANVVRERADRPNLVGRVKRSPLVQRALYRPLDQDRPVMTPQERLAVIARLDDEVTELDRMFGLGLRRRWGWDQAVEVAGRI